MEQLSSDIFIYGICRYLSIKEVNRLLCVNRYTSSYADSEKLWRHLFNRDLSVKRVPSTSYREAYRSFIRDLRWHVVDNRTPCGIITERGYEILLLHDVSNPDYPTFEVFSIVAKYGYTDIIDGILAFHCTHLNTLWKGITESGNVELLDRYMYLWGHIINDSYYLDQSLTYAIRHRHDQMVDRLLTLGARNYNVALEQASRIGNLVLIKRLIDLGANAFNQAIIGALHNNRFDSIELLKQYFWPADYANHLAFQVTGCDPQVRASVLIRLIDLGANNLNELLGHLLNGPFYLDLIKVLVSRGADYRPYVRPPDPLVMFLDRYPDIVFSTHPMSAIWRYLRSLP